MLLRGECASVRSSFSAGVPFKITLCKLDICTAFMMSYAQVGFK
jgi:hypothetical protein